MAEKEVREKRALRLCPCPAYDVEGMESWLSDMADKGLLLEQDGFFAGVATFVKAPPQSMQYRLAAAMKDAGMWGDEWNGPDEDTVELSQHMGWEYVATRGQFHIYRSARPGVRELNTDPEVQALALNAVRKRQLDNLFHLIFWVVIYNLLYLHSRSSILLTMIGLRTWFFLLGAALVAWHCVDCVRHAVHLSRLKKKLQTDGVLEHKTDWQRRANRYWIKNAVQITLLVLWICLLLYGWSRDVLEEDKIPLSAYEGDPPFATMTDFAPGGDHAYHHYGFSNTVEVWSDLLSPVNYDWQETARITLSNGRQVEGGLYVYYHETIHPLLARKIAEDYWRMDRRSKRYAFLDELSGLDVDFAVAYRDEIGFPTVVLQKGNLALRARFYQTGEDTLTLEEWAFAMANSLR